MHRLLLVRNSPSMIIAELCSNVQFHSTSFLNNVKSGAVIVDLLGMYWAKYLIMPSKCWGEGISVGGGMSTIAMTFFGPNENWFS